MGVDFLVMKFWWSEIRLVLVIAAGLFIVTYPGWLLIKQADCARWSKYIRAYEASENCARTVTDRLRYQRILEWSEKCR